MQTTHPTRDEPSDVARPAWYLVHTKPRQEERARLNLEQQGYVCFVPTLQQEKLRRGKLTVVSEALFPRYLFIRLDSSLSGRSWGPIRSTLGVSTLVCFGNVPAQIAEHLIEHLQQQQLQQEQHGVQALYVAGEALRITSGPFAGLDAIYQMKDGEQRALVLIELLGRPSALRLAFDHLQRRAD
jgi:transcriptional antiterminator RfaH